MGIILLLKEIFLMFDVCEFWGFGNKEKKIIFNVFLNKNGMDWFGNFMIFY